MKLIVLLNFLFFIKKKKKNDWIFWKKIEVIRENNEKVTDYLFKIKGNKDAISSTIKAIQEELK